MEDKAGSEKVIGKKRYTVSNMRHYNVARDSLRIDYTCCYTFNEIGDPYINMEYEGDSKRQIYPYKPFIGCGSNHMSVIADFTSDLANHEAFNGRQSLYS